MFKDLDLEMQKRGVNGIVVFGDTTLANPDLTYVAGGTLPRGGTYFKRQGKPPLLIVSNLDVGSAREHGRVRRIETWTQRGREGLVRKYHTDEVEARIFAEVLKDEGFSGKIGLYGRNDVASGIHLANRLRKFGLEIVGSSSPTILEVARETKERRELEELRDVGMRTSTVVNGVFNVLRNLRRKRGRLYVRRKRATIGLLKSIISSKLASQDLIAPEGTIFAIGPSGADPHNMGVRANEIKEGRLIVFDIFPQAESGYWSDLTRTFVIGRAPLKARKLYETVYAAQHDALDLIRAGVAREKPMLSACKVIERAGYRTLRDLYDGKVKSLPSGFNHSLGHGVGLTIGERPYLSLLRKDKLRTGHVVTVEPGVYLPKYGGVRIEDTVAVTAGGFENFAKVEKELEFT